MNDLSKKQAASREKTLLIALLLSAPGPMVTGLAALSGHSTTQLADFIRRSVELMALFISWWVFRQLQRNRARSEAEASQLEHTAGLSVAAAMICSGIVMLSIAVSRLSAFEPGGRVVPSLTIALLGLLTNGWFWRRYTFLTHEQYSSVIASQQQLYRAKASVDLCVCVALAAVVVAPTHPATHTVDTLGSVIVAGYLLWSGLRAARSHRGGLGRSSRYLRKRLWTISCSSVRKDNQL